MQNWRGKIGDWLRWSEKYTKTDMVYLAKGGFWTLFGQVSSAILSFVLILVFANLVSKETYGLYRYVLSLAGILNIFTLTGMNQAVAQAVAAGKEQALRVSVRYQLKWNLLMFAAFAVLGTYYALNGNWELTISFWVMGLFLPATAALNTYNAYLTGKKNFPLANIFGATSTLIYVAGMVVVIALSGNLIWLVVGYSATIFLANLIFYLIVLRIYRPPNTTSADAKEVLGYGRHLTFINYISPIASQLDSIILNHFWGAASLATYFLATTMPNRATVMLKSSIDVGFPKFSEKTAGEINSIFYRRIVQGLLIGVAGTIAYVVISPFLFHYLIPKYLDGLFYSQLLAVSFVFALPNRYVSLLFTAQKLAKTILINNFIQNIVRILLYVILGIWGGILGLIIAQLLVAFSSLIINIIVWQLATKGITSSVQ